MIPYPRFRRGRDPRPMLKRGFSFAAATSSPRTATATGASPPREQGAGATSWSPSARGGPPHHPLVKELLQICRSAGGGKTSSSVHSISTASKTKAAFARVQMRQWLGGLMSSSASAVCTRPKFRKNSAPPFAEKFDPADLVTILVKFSKFGLTDEYFLECWLASWLLVCRTYDFRRIDVGSRDVASRSTRIDRGATGGGAAGTTPGAVVLSSAVHAVANVCRGRIRTDRFSDRFLEVWFRKAAGAVAEFDARSLTNSVWALAVLLLPDERLQDGIGEAAGGRHLRGKQKQAQDFLQLWLAEAERKIPFLNEREMVVVLYALAKLLPLLGTRPVARRTSNAESSCPPREDKNQSCCPRGEQSFLRCWFSRGQQLCARFNAQDLSNSIWAMAQLEEAGLDVGAMSVEFTAIWLSVAAPKLTKFNEQELTNAICGLAGLRGAELPCDMADSDQQQFPPEVMLDWVARHWVPVSRRQMSAFSIQGIVNSAWAVASLMTDVPNSVPAL